MHGTTIHGAEKFQNDDGTPVTGRPEPITYYHKDGGIGQADHARSASARERRCKVAVIGARLRHARLRCRARRGAGSSSRSTRSMVDTARDPKYFTYIPSCEPRPGAGDRRCAADLRAASPTASTT